MIIPPTSYICYYGPNQLERLGRVDWVIIQAGHYTPADLAWLRQAQTHTFAYLSVGEEPLDGVAGVKGWHIQTEDVVSPQQMINAQWQTAYVDCRHEAWQAHLLEEIIPQLRTQGFAGLFLDTLDVQERFPHTRPGVWQLLRRLRRTFPDLLLIANRGFSLLPEMASLVDALLFESYSSYHQGDSCWPWPVQDHAWLAVQAARLQATGLPVLALDYANPDQPELIKYAHGRARAAGFIPYTTNWTLDLIQ